MFYNYSQRPQTYGIGSTIKLIQQDISVNATTNYDMDFYATEVDMLTTALNYKYCKILEVALVQDNINLPNEQEKLYGYIDWGDLGDIEQGVLDKNDNAKIFKNIGKNCFKFKPPRITTEINVQTGSSTSSNRTVSFNGFNTCATLYGSATNGYRMPFSVALSNKTASARVVKVIVKILFRGSIARSTSSLASKMEEIANRDKSIKEIIREKEQELYNLKLKEKMLVEEGIQTDEVLTLINNQPDLDLSIQADNKIFIQSEKQKQIEERKRRQAEINKKRDEDRKIVDNELIKIKKQVKNKQQLVDYVYSTTKEKINKEEIDKDLQSIRNGDHQNATYMSLEMAFEKLPNTFMYSFEKQLIASYYKHKDAKWLDEDEHMYDDFE